MRCLNNDFGIYIFVEGACTMSQSKLEKCTYRHVISTNLFEVGETSLFVKENMHNNKVLISHTSILKSKSERE